MVNQEACTKTKHPSINKLVAFTGGTTDSIWRPVLIGPVGMVCLILEQPGGYLEVVICKELETNQF